MLKGCAKVTLIHTKILGGYRDGDEAAQCLQDGLMGATLNTSTPTSASAWPIGHINRTPRTAANE